MPVPHPPVYVVHGLHQNSWAIMPLVNKLRQHQLSAKSFRYYSLKDAIDIHAKRLHEFLMNNHPAHSPFNLVGHSLGGLVIRTFLAQYPNWQVQRVVTLGTPHNGSTTAHYAHRWLKPLIGQAYHNALDGNCLAMPSHIELGIIAGTKSFGLGLPFLYHHQRKHALLDHAHDGTVFVFETKLACAKEHITLPVTHSALLTNQLTADLTANFLKHGQFCISDT